MKLLLNGTLVPPDQYDGEVNTSIEVRTNDENENREKVVSNEYEFSGAAFQLISDTFITNPAGKNAFLFVKIYEDKCCETDILLFEGIIRGDMVDWCHEDCKATAKLVEHTAETKKMDCLKSTLVWDNWNGFLDQVHPKMVYCVEVRPSFQEGLRIGMCQMLNVLFLILYPMAAITSFIYSAINTIITALNSLGFSIEPLPGFDGDSTTSLLQEYNNFVNQLNEKCISCGRKHPSPLVRHYIENACAKCGVTFSSSIFTDSASDYYNTVYMNAPVVKGTLDDSVKLIADNRPLKTTDMMLNDLNFVFNARWKLMDSVLYFERKDYFYAGSPWINFEQLKSDQMIIGKLCLDWSDEKRYAYGDFGYTEDAGDICGNEAKIRFDDIVEWNNPYSEIQTDPKIVRLPFSRPRFRDDGIDADVLALAVVDVPGPNTLFDTIAGFQGVMILSNGTTFNPKLIIWDGEDYYNGKAKRFMDTGVELPEGAYYNYNFPYQFNQINDNDDPDVTLPTTEPGAGLYPRFWRIDNPKSIIDQGKTFTFTTKFNCEILQGFYQAQYVQLPMGTGRIMSMRINPTERTITISGNV